MSGVLKGLAALAAATAILYGMQKTTPGYGEITAPRPIRGASGQRVLGNAFAVTIDKVEVARTLVSRGVAGDRRYTTSGVWVLVEATVEALDESLSLLSADWLGQDGIRYAISERLLGVPGLLPSQRFEPGLPTPVLMAFEVPESQIAGGTLLLARSAWKPLEEQARIAIAGVAAGDIRSAVVVARTQGAVPWAVSVP